MLAAEPPGFVTFGAGETTATLTVATLDDAVVEDRSAVSAAVTAGEGYEVAADAAPAQVSVEDNDVASFAVSADPIRIAEGEAATVTVEVTGGVTFAEEQAIALDFAGSTAVRDADFTVSPESLTLPAGARAVAATVTALDDTELEAAEPVTVAARHGGVTVGSATVTISADASEPLRAQFLGMPARHSGSTSFRFELQFSEEVQISYRTLEGGAFQVTAGSVRTARRLDPPSNRRWEITVRPDSEAEVVLALPATADCDAADAVCTLDGRPLSHRLEATIRGPGFPEVAISPGRARSRKGRRRRSR